MHKPSTGSKSSQYSLHIPRVSLNSSSCSGSGSSSKSSSRSREFSPNPVDISDRKFSEMEGESETEVYHTSAVDDRKVHQNISDDETSRRPNHPMYIVYKCGKPQRKFNSTQSSSSSSSAASNQSNYSVNTLLLSVKNLENFNRNAENVKSGNGGSDSKMFSNKSDNIYRKQMLSNLKNIVTIDRPDTRKHIQEKEPDQLSTTSTTTNTNFTVITFNGFGKNNRKKSRAICRRRHQVTIVILIMTFLLFIGIFGAVCMLEMRYQKMPR